MHDNKITHRDLKPENILLTDQSPSAILKVVDFGLSKFVNSPQGMMSTVIGTWAYCAPEVFSRRPYTDAVDNWALGVLMFIMLSGEYSLLTFDRSTDGVPRVCWTSGYHPFDLYGDSSEAQLIENICSGKFNFEEPEWQDVSKEGIESNRVPPSFFEAYRLLFVQPRTLSRHSSSRTRPIGCQSRVS